LFFRIDGDRLREWPCLGKILSLILAKGPLNPLQRFMRPLKLPDRHAQKVLVFFDSADDSNKKKVLAMLRLKCSKYYLTEIFFHLQVLTAS